MKTGAHSKMSARVMQSSGRLLHRRRRWRRRLIEGVIQRLGQRDVAGAQSVDGAGQGQQLGVSRSRIAQADNGSVDGGGQFRLSSGPFGYGFGQCFEGGHKFLVSMLRLMLNVGQPVPKLVNLISDEVNQGQFSRRIVRHCRSESTARATQHKPGDFPLDSETDHSFGDDAKTRWPNLTVRNGARATVRTDSLIPSLHHRL